MARLNIFQNYPLLARIAVGALYSANTMNIIGVIIPGSISFNNLVMAFSGSGGVSENLTVSFGLYSLNGSTLSLANSASASTALTLNQTAFSWLTSATSATQDITPGNWYFAAVSATSLGASFSLANHGLGAGDNFNVGPGHGGIFVRGWYPTSVTALPASIATSDLSKEGSTGDLGAIRNPLVIISA